MIDVLRMFERRFQAPEAPKKLSLEEPGSKPFACYAREARRPLGEPGVRRLRREESRLAWPSA